jgi:hypothetical protein
MRARIALLIAAIATFGLSCKDSTGPQPYVCPNAYSGITETDEMGAQTGSVDSDDWQPTGELVDLVAFPNPAKTTCDIYYHLVDSLRVRIRIQDRPGHTIRQLVDASETAGSTHKVTWDFKDDSGNALPDCIYRVVFEVDAPGGLERSHGDIQLER